MYTGGFRITSRLLAALVAASPAQGDLYHNPRPISVQHRELASRVSAGRMEISMTGVTLTRRGLALVARGTSSGQMQGALKVLAWKRGESDGHTRLRLQIEFRCGEGKIRAVGRVSALPPLEGTPNRPLGGTLRLEDGEGSFRSVRGPLHVSGTVDMQLRRARLEYRRGSFPSSPTQLTEIPDAHDADPRVS